MKTISSHSETASTPSVRQHQFDWLRVLAFLLLIPYHTGMIFVVWKFHIKNDETSHFLEFFMLLLNRWRLPLLFLVSGVGTYFALRSRSGFAFFKERFFRLFVPLVFGMFVVVPPQIYYERLQNGENIDYLTFYKTVFELVAYPAGSFSWHHLWFVAYLFIFSWLCIPLFLYFKSEKGKSIFKSLAIFLEKGKNVYWVLLPALLLHLLLDPYFPTTHDLLHDWANFSTSLYVFLLGYFLASQTAILEKLARLRFLSLFIALFFYFLFLFLRETNLLEAFLSPKVEFAAYVVLNNGLGGFAIMAILGLAQYYLKQDHAFLRYANAAVYPFYILHQTLMIAIGYYVIDFQINWFLKFVIINILTFLFSWLGYEILKRTALTRFLFGIKRNKVVER
ncbi:acyltransferase family protein [Hugenholtzia roseola]|uniref:acyltransferase family protein n=1 Tax=Hugenholtzia roseola TaxID=1002 RepID=UPI00040CBF20|nr:acyltransferase family protein [Hugenholtzia roseola]